MEQRICLDSYSLELVALESSPTLLGSLISLNDSGTVAYTRYTSTENQIWVAQPDFAPRMIASATGNQSFRSPVQINNSGWVVNTQAIVSSTDINVWNSNGPPNTFRQVAHAFTGGTQPLARVFSSPSIANDGTVAFVGGYTTTGPIGVFRGDVAQTPPASPANTWTQVGLSLASPQPTLSPMAADGGAIVDRHGSTATSSIQLFRPATATLNLATSADFSVLGATPGISDDGTAVAFFGDRSSGSVPGPGTFLVDIENLGSVRIAGSSTGGNGTLEPWETYDDVNRNGSFDPGSETDSSQFSNFSADTRVAVAGSFRGPHDNATAVYVAFDTLGNKALYATRVRRDTSAGSATYRVGAPQRVLGVGDSVSGGTIQDFSVYDPVNNRGQIAVHAVLTSGAAAILRATPPPAAVVNVVTHGFGVPLQFPLESSLVGVVFNAIGGVTEPLHAIGTALENVPKPGSALDGEVQSYVAQWASSDGWVPASVSLLVGTYFTAAGLTLPAAAAFAEASLHMKVADQLARSTAQRVVDELIAQDWLDDPELSQTGEQIIHLVGHSRGAAVNALVTRLLSERGYFVDQYTALDGYSTDWPAGSSLLGDISIVEEIAAAGSNLGRKVNYRVQDGLEQFLVPLAETFLSALSPALVGLSQVAFGPSFVSTIAAAALGWKAPLRVGFQNQTLVTTGGPSSNHINIAGPTGIYTLSGRSAIPADERYLWDNYVGMHREDPAGHSALQPSGSASGSNNAAASGPLLSSQGGFVDGNFEELAALQRQIVAADLSSDGDNALATWVALAQQPYPRIATVWNGKGDLDLLDNGTDAELQLTQTSETSIGQSVILPANATKLEFDLVRTVAGAGDRLEIVYRNQVIHAIALDAGPVDGLQSVALDAYSGSSGLLQLRLAGAIDTAAIIVLDNLQIVAGELVGDANGDGEVGAADYAIWAAQFGQAGVGLAADFDGNGSVGAGDYALWAANFGRTTAGAAARASAATDAVVTAFAGTGAVGTSHAETGLVGARRRALASAETSGTGARLRAAADRVFQALDPGSRRLSTGSVVVSARAPASPMAAPGVAPNEAAPGRLWNRVLAAAGAPRAVRRP